MIKKISNMTLALGMIFFCAGNAQASDLYVGISAGAFNLGTGVTKKTVGGGFVQVGDDFSEYLGAEIRLGASGKTGEELTTQPRTGIDYFAAAFLKPKYDFNDQWMGYALLGVATLRASYSQGALPKQTKTRTGYAYGLGLQYRFADNYALAAEYSHMLGKPKTDAVAIKTNFKGLESSVFTLGLKYYFY